MKSRNLNYCYYVEYYEHQQLRFTEPQSDDTAAVLKKNNKCLTDYEASKNELMTSLADILVLNKFELQTVYPGLLIGVGIAHGFNGKGEAALGLCLDYVTGMPYIPGSSVKGVLRSAFKHPEYIKELLKSVKFQGADSIDVHELEAHIFGNALEGKQYSVKPSETDTFFDAVVVSTGKLLATDAITPHRGDEELLELAAPNPITMIRIRPGVRFLFQFSLHKVTMKVTADQKLKLFQKIIEDFGIGAKTNVGYGTFEEVQKIDPTICPNCGGHKNANYPLCQKCAQSTQNSRQSNNRNRRNR